MAKIFSSYPVKAEKDGNLYALSFRDIPEALGQASSKDEIVSEALDVLKIVLGYYLKEGTPIPAASLPKKGEIQVDLPASLASKIILHNTMLKNRIRPADLARLMGIPTSEIARITSPKAKTKIDTMAAAISAAGGKLLLASD